MDQILSATYPELSFFPILTAYMRVVTLLLPWLPSVSGIWLKVQSNRTHMR